MSGSKFKRVYKVLFNGYAAFTALDTNRNRIKIDKDESTGIYIPEPFLIFEDELEKYAKYGNGYSTVSYVGEMIIAEEDKQEQEQEQEQITVKPSCIGNDADDSDQAIERRKLRDAAKIIRDYCDHQICEECPFDEGYENQCKIHGRGKPFTWEVD